MMVQANTECSVKALEIHPEVALVASENFEQSPFKDRLQVIQSDISVYHSEVNFDFICSNPPFFTNHLPATDPARHIAIHADHLSPADLANSIDRLLAEDGEFAVLYPADVLALFEKSLENVGLFINEKVHVLSKPDSPVLRLMARGSRKEKLNEERSLPIKNEQGDYSPEFIELLRPYYIIFPS
jgi:tRNA1Val (adenine37-N6)-methyltransferase